MNNINKREPDYPAELESQFVLRLPEEPAKTLRELLKSGDNMKNRLSIQMDNDMRHGVVRFDHWLLHSKIVDLPTIIESHKTIDNKSFYKTADLCQMMICKEEPDPATTEEENSTKSKKKDPFKVDKKFLWPHGITPPTKNVRRRRFRKTLKKKFVEAPEIEKEVKRLLRADNEAISVTWEVIKEEESHPTPKKIAPVKTDKKQKSDRSTKRELGASAKKSVSSNVVDIFGGAVSDSDLDDDNVNAQLENSHISGYGRFTDTNFIQGLGESSNKRETFPIEFKPHLFQSRKMAVSHTITSTTAKSGSHSSDEELDSQTQHDMSKDNMTFRISEVKAELEELKQRKQRTQHELSGMENLALRQRFQDILHTLNQDIMFKEMEYQGMITLQNSEDI